MFAPLWIPWRTDGTCLLRFLTTIRRNAALFPREDPKPWVNIPTYVAP
jgi:hypothetical protein